MKRWKLSFLAAVALAASLLTQSVTAYAAENGSGNLTTESPKAVVSETASTESEEAASQEISEVVAVDEDKDDLSETAADKSERTDENTAEEESGRASEIPDEDTSESSDNATSQNSTDNTSEISTNTEDEEENFTNQGSTSGNSEDSETAPVEEQKPEIELSSTEDIEIVVSTDEYSVEFAKPKEETKFLEFNKEISTEDGTLIEVNAPEGAFPEGIQLKVKSVDSEQVLDVLKDATGSELAADDILAYDFDFYLDEEHHDIEPEKEVSISFSNLKDFISGDDEVTFENEEEDANNTNISIYHIDDQITKAEQEKEVVVDTNDFSVKAEVDNFCLFTVVRAPVLLSSEEDNGDVKEFTYTMHNHYWYAPTVIGQISSIPDAEGKIGSALRNMGILDNCYNPALYQKLKDNPDFHDIDAFFEYARSRTIVSWDCGKDYYTNSNGIKTYYNSLIAPVYFRFSDYLSEDILNCAKEYGLEWSTNTQLSNLTAEFHNDLSFYDENGEPADFIRKINNSSAYRYWDWDSLAHDPGAESFDKGDGLESPVYTASSITQGCSGIRLMKGEEEVTSLTFDQFPAIGMISGTTMNSYYFNRKYLGTLIVKPELRLVFCFTVDGQKYQFTLKTPDTPYDFEVVRGEYTHSGEKSDSDIVAVITRNGAQSEKETEHQQVTAVQYGDQIAYQIDISTEAEAEMFYQLQNAMCKMNGLYFNEEDLKKLEGITNPESYYQPFLFYEMKDEYGNKDWAEYPRIKVDFTIPLELIDLESLANNSINFYNNIALTQEGESALQWEIVSRYFDLDETYTSLVIHVELALKEDVDLSKIIKIRPDKTDLSQLANRMNQIRSDKLTLKIPEITVSQNAKVGKYYTAKAKISGHMHRDYEAVLSTDRTPRAKSGNSDGWDIEEPDWGDEEAGWDDETVIITSSQSALMKTSALKAAGALSAPDTGSFELLSAQENAESESSTSSEENTYSASDFQVGVHGVDYDERDIVPSLDYTWYHLQDVEGRDAIQSAEEAKETKELWYTVVIPAATISKDIWDDAPEDDQIKDFTFGIQLKNIDLFGQTFDAARGVKQDDGSVSYNDTTETETVIFDENGYAEIKLKPGEVLAIGLPDGCEYTVKEILEDESYVVEYQYMSASGDETLNTGTYKKNDGISGKVEAAKYTESDSVNIIDVTGTNFPAGVLSIAKLVSSPEDDMAEEKNKEFSFVLTLENDDIDVDSDYSVKLYTDGIYNSSLGVFEYTQEPSEETRTITDGQIEFTLKHGQTLEIDGLPRGTQFVITETDADDFTVTGRVDGTSFTGTEANGTLSEKTSAVTFINTFINDAKGILKVTKKVEGSGIGDADKSREFPFRVTLAETSVTGKYGDLEFKDGIAEFTLKDGETKTAFGLPEDVKYTVEETDPGDFETSGGVDNTAFTGTVTTGTLSEKTSAVTFVNRKETSGDTPEKPEHHEDHDHDNPGSTPEPGTWAIKVNKVWANDDPSTRPSSVQMQLYKNDQAYGNPVTLMENGGWSYTWNNLEANQEYTVGEVNVPEGYHSTATYKKSVWTVTNTKLPVAENTSTNTPSEPEEPEGKPFIGTGDDSAAGLWLMLMVASAGVLLAMAARKKRNGR